MTYPVFDSAMDIRQILDARSDVVLYIICVLIVVKRSLKGADQWLVGSREFRQVMIP